MKTPTLQDIAERVGVSCNTVSLALRNSPRISERTRERVRAAAEEIGYRPNPLVAALMQSRRRGRAPAATANLAFLHNYPTEEGWRRRPHCVEMFRGASQRAAELGFTLATVWAWPGHDAAELTRTLLSRGVVGVVLPPVFGFLPPPSIEWDRFAASAIGPTLKTPELHRVGVDFRGLIPIAARELAALGYRRIGVLISPRSNARTDYAWDAGLAMARRRRLTGRVSLVPYRRPGLGMPGFSDWMRAHRIQALIVAGHGDVAERLAAMRLRAPEDIGVADVVNDDAPFAVVMRHDEAVGALAVETTVNQLLHNERGVPALRQTILVEGRWEPRAGVRRLAAAPPAS